MDLIKKYEFTLESIKGVFSYSKYRFISVISSVIIFSFLYYLFVAKVADNDIFISVMMSGAGFVTLSIITVLVTAILSGILLSILLFKFRLYNHLGGKGLFGFVGSGIVAFGVGCPTCGAFLF